MMTIDLPDDLERSINAAVQGGRFATADELIAQAVRSFLHTPAAPQAKPGSAKDASAPDPLLGLMRDAADELDEIVADAYRHRREERWREFDLE